MKKMLKKLAAVLVVFLLCFLLAAPASAASFPGDVNSDSRLDLKDVVRYKKYSVGQSVSINLAVADLNSDGRYNAADIAVLQAMVLSDLFGVPKDDTLAELQSQIPSGSESSASSGGSSSSSVSSSVSSDKGVSLPIIFF